MFMYLHRASRHYSTTLTEVFPCFLLSCKVNARVKSAKLVHGPQPSQIFVLFYILYVLFYCVLFVCKGVLYYCHRLSTLLRLTNMPYISDLTKL